MKSALLLGSFGQSNLGDDILFDNFVRLLARKGYDRIYVNVAQADLLPASVMAKYGEQLSIFETYSTSAIQLLKIMVSVDVVAYGGGTIYKDLYKSTGRSKHAVVARMMLFNLTARICRKPIYNLCIGIGSIRTRLGKWYARYALRCCALTIFRDEVSYDYALHKLRIAPAEIRLGSDAIFLRRYRKVQETKKPKHRNKVLGVNVVSDIPDNVDRETYIYNLVQFINGAMANGYTIRFVPFQSSYNPNNDKKFIEQNILPALKHDNYDPMHSVSLEQLSAVLGSIDYFVGSRFHSLLLCVMLDIPFVCIEYDPKCSRLVQDLRHERTVTLNQLSAAHLSLQLAKLASEPRPNYYQYRQANRALVRSTIKEAL